MAINSAIGNQQTRNEIGSEPDVQPIYVVLSSNVLVEEGSTIVSTSNLGNAWIVGSSTNGLVGTNTGTQGGGQQVVGAGGRTSVVVAVSNPANIYTERFSFDTFNDTSSTTATWDTVNQKLDFFPATSYDASLIHYWKLNESSGDAADEIGSWTLTNTGVTFASGKLNNAATATSTNNLTKSSGISENEPTTYTIEAWVKFNDTNTNGVLMYCKTDSNDAQFIMAQIDGGNYKFYVSHTHSGSSDRYGYCDTVLSSGVWYHIAVCVNLSGNTVIYIHNAAGSLIETKTQSAAITGNTGINKFVIGDLPDISNSTVSVDDVRIWNDIRSESEITANVLTEFTATAAGFIGQSLSVALVPSSQPQFTKAIYSHSVDVSANVSVQLSADGGSHWESITVGTEYSFIYPGRDLRFKVTATDSAEITYIRISYS